MMSYEEWNQTDSFFFKIYFQQPPPLLETEGLDAVLAIIEEHAGPLRPDKVYDGRHYNYSRERARQTFLRKLHGKQGSLCLTRKSERDTDIFLVLYGEGTRFQIWGHMRLPPFRQPGQAEVLAEQIMGLFRALGARFPLSYGFAHSRTDEILAKDPHSSDPFAELRVDQAWWLNLYGRGMVEDLGRERVLSVPGAHVEELPDGAVLWLSRPTLADFDSEEARRAQARCLVHLRPELAYADVLADLRERSKAFVPIEKNFTPELADLIERQLKPAHDLVHRRAEIERFNSYRPPPVAECLPATEVPTPDVEDVASALELYSYHAEELVALVHDKVHSVFSGSPDSLVDVDAHVLREGWAKRYEHDEGRRDWLTKMLGAYLGEVLVDHLGGRWGPRRNMLEACVVVGPTAWRPFLRARHFLDPAGFPLDSSLTQLFRAAARAAPKS